MTWKYAVLLVITSLASAQIVLDTTDTTAAGAAVTVVAQTIVGPDGNPAAGQMLIRISKACRTKGAYVGAKTIAVKFAATQSNFSVQLVPNDADGCKGTSYSVARLITGGQNESETWVVPSMSAGSSVSVDSVVVTGASIPNWVIQWQQMGQDGAAAGEAVVYNGVSWLPGYPSGATFVDGEVPSGTLDGVNVVFNLAGTPNPPASLLLARNGLVQKPVVDFTLAGSTVTFVSASTPQPTDVLIASYRTGGSGTAQPGALQLSAAAGPPTGNCLAPTSAALLGYLDTVGHDLWLCLSTNTWKRALATTNSVPFLVQGLVSIAPGPPPANNLACYFDSTSLTQICLDPSGNASTTVRGVASATAHDWVQYVDSQGVQHLAQPNYSDIAGTPPSQVNSDWNDTSGVAQILNKPTLATVATSGSYLDLSNKPTIPAVQVNSDWNASSGVAQILNKPTIPTTTSQISEASNLYFTNARVLAAMAGLYEVPLSFNTGLTRSTNTITCNTATTSAFGCLTAADWNTFNGKQGAITTGTTSQYFRGDLSLATLPTIPSNTSQISESGNLYFTNARAQAAISATGIINYNPSTGVISCPTCGSASGVPSVFGRTGNVIATSGDYNTSQVTESGNLYFTNARVLSAMSGLYQSPITTGTTAQYFRGDLSLATFPTTWAWGSLSGVPSTFTPSAHNLLSASHGDTTAASPTRGDGIFALGPTPTWQRLGHPPTGGYFKWNGTDIVASSGPAAGTGSCTNQAVTAANADAAPTCTTITSAYVDTSIAKTGADINTSNQVTGINGTAFSGTNGHLVSFGASNVPADSGVVAANAVVASSPGAGVAHFAGSTQTVTSSAVVEADQTLADNTTNNVSTSKHGYAPKAPNDATKYLDGTGAYSVPAGGGATFPATMVYFPGFITPPSTYATSSGQAGGVTQCTDFYDPYTVVVSSIAWVADVSSGTYHQAVAVLDSSGNVLTGGNVTSSSGSVAWAKITGLSYTLSPGLHSYCWAWDSGASGAAYMATVSYAHWIDGAGSSGSGKHNYTCNVAPTGSGATLVIPTNGNCATSGTKTSVADNSPGMVTVVLNQ